MELEPADDPDDRLGSEVCGLLKGDLGCIMMAISAVGIHANNTRILNICWSVFSDVLSSLWLLRVSTAEFQGD